jgi:uncharacterized OB-fold protein
MFSHVNWNPPKEDELYIVDGSNSTISIHRYGWICPRCNRVYGPSWNSCGICNMRIEEKESVKEKKRIGEF